MRNLFAWIGGMAILLCALLIVSGCQPQDSSQSLKPVVNALVDAWNTGNTDGLDAVVDAGYVRHASQFSKAGATSLEELKTVIANFRVNYPDCHVRLDEEIYSGNTSTVRWTFTGTNSGAENPAFAGKAVELSGVSVSHYANGKLVEEWAFADFAEIMSQLGFAMTPPEAE